MESYELLSILLFNNLKYFLLISHSLNNSSDHFIEFLHLRMVLKIIDLSFNQLQTQKIHYDSPTAVFPLHLLKSIYQALRNPFVVFLWYLKVGFFTRFLLHCILYSFLRKTLNPSSLNHCVVNVHCVVRLIYFYYRIIQQVYRMFHVLLCDFKWAMDSCTSLRKPNKTLQLPHCYSIGIFLYLKFIGSHPLIHLY